MLKVLKTYDGYITAEGNGVCFGIDEANDEEMVNFLSRSGNELTITADGVFFPGRDDDVFEGLASAAPKAYFIGDIDAIVCGVSETISAELKEGKLYLSNFDGSFSGEDFYEIYLAKNLSKEMFCEIFKIEKDDWCTDCFLDFIADAYEVGFPTEISYDDFCEHFPYAEISEDQFNDAIQKVLALGILDFDTFSDTLYEDLDSIGVDYDELCARKSVLDLSTGIWEEL